MEVEEVMDLQRLLGIGPNTYELVLRIVDGSGGTQWGMEMACLGHGGRMQRGPTLGVMRVIYGCRRKLDHQEVSGSPGSTGIPLGSAQLAAKCLGTYCDIHYGHGPACLAFLPPALVMLRPFTGTSIVELNKTLDFILTMDSIPRNMCGILCGEQGIITTTIIIQN
jgi:hypothetical protein